MLRSAVINDWELSREHGRLSRSSGRPDFSDLLGSRAWSAPAKTGGTGDNIGRGRTGRPGFRAWGSSPRIYTAIVGFGCYFAAGNSQEGPRASVCEGRSGNAIGPTRRFHDRAAWAAEPLLCQIRWDWSI